jgi:hypothetical protein
MPSPLIEWAREAIYLDSACARSRPTAVVRDTGLSEGAIQAHLTLFIGVTIGLVAGLMVRVYCAQDVSSAT